MNYDKIIADINNQIVSIPHVWDGKISIMEMKGEDYPHWRQSEWIGFYFQFLCNSFLKDTMIMPGTKYGRSEFDGFYNIPWDFKVHPKYTSTGGYNNTLIVNDREAIMSGISEFGAVGILLAVGEATYNDVDRSFQRWHTELKGGGSRYEVERVARNAPSRLRKVAFSLTSVEYILLTEETLPQFGSFQKGFRNSNGNPRREKVSLNLQNISPYKTYLIN